MATRGLYSQSPFNGVYRVNSANIQSIICIQIIIDPRFYHILGFRHETKKNIANSKLDRVQYWNCTQLRLSSAHLVTDKHWSKS